MKIIRGFLRLISILLLIGIVGFVVYFGLVTYGVIDSPYDKKAELISLSQSEIRLKRNKSFQLTSKVYPENTRNGRVRYKSDKEDIVSVNEVTGYVEAKKNGIATITAYLESNENIKAECLVVVSENNIRIKKIIVSPKNINLQIGKKYQISFKYTPREATLHEFEYMTSDPEVAIIDNLGMIEAKAEGQAYITVSDKVTGIQDSALVKVFSSEDNPGDDIHDDVTDPTGLEVSPQKVTINVDGSKQISAKVKPAIANQSVTWESIDTSIATVNSKGVVTGKQVGSTKIAATTVNGIEKLIDVTVTDKVVSVTGISVKNSNITLDVGKRAEIEYTIKPSNATNQGVTITSSDNGIVKVDGNKIIAMESGMAKVTIRTNDGGYKATINVKVNNVSRIIDETDINLSKTNVNLTIGGTTKVEASVVPSNATYQTVMWSSSDPNIASVNNGLIEGKSAGTTEVTVTTSHKNISKKIKVTVSNVEAQSISLNKKTLDLIVGSKDSLTVTFTPNNTSNKTIAWTSSNTGVAAVKDGLVVAKGVGTATITAKSSNGKTATCTVNVKADNVPVQSVSLNINAINTTVDDEIHLIATINPSNATNKKVTWESSNTSVATVSDGVVKTKGVGTATITVTTVNGKKDTCKVTVNSSIIDVQSVTLNTNSIKTKVGEEVSLTSTVYPSNATNKTVTWTSSDQSVATVSNTGVVTAMKEGTTTITATSNNGKTATCKVTVEKATVAVTSISLDNTSITVKVDASKTLTATVYPDNATDKTVTWESSDTGVATVSSSGKVTGKKVGTATITAKTSNGKTATCKVTVEKVATTGYVITEDSKYSSYSNKASYSSSTFKYRIFSYKSQDIVLLWVADPKTQLESALAYSNAQGVLPAETILKNEIKNYSLQNKGLVAVNASFFSSGSPNGGVVLSHGKIAKNNGNTSAGVIGVTNKGKLKLYVNEPASTFSNDGVRSTFVISSQTSIDHSTNNTNRTQICQYDTNNFVLLSGSGTVSGCGNIIISLTGCQEPYNLDGGGSRKLYYKTKDMSEPKRVFGGDRQLPDMLYFHD